MKDYFVASAGVMIRIEGAVTLKDRRQVVRSLLDRLRSRGLSACDVDGGQHVNAARLALAFVSAEATLARQMIQDAVAFIEDDGRAEVVSVEYDLY